MKKLIILALIPLSLSLKSQAWIKENLNTSKNLNDVFFLNAEYGLIVGDSGTIFRYSEQSWHKIQTNISDDLNAVFIVDANNSWICGDNGTILNVIADTLIRYNSTKTENLNDIFMLDSITGWIIGDLGTTLRYNGSEWENFYIESSKLTPNPNHLNYVDLKQIDFLNDTFGLIVGDRGAFIMYKKEWQDLTSMNTFFYSSVFIRDTNNILLGIFQTGHWSLNSHGIYSYPPFKGMYYVGETSQPIKSIKLKDNTGWAVGRSGEILKYYGSSFKLFQTINSPLNSLSILNDSISWIVGDNGYLLRFSKYASNINNLDVRGIRIYPNPFDENIYIQTNNSPIDRVEIYDINGKTIMINDCKANYRDIINFNLNFLDKGLYIIRIVEDNIINVNILIKK